MSPTSRTPAEPALLRAAALALASVLASGVAACSGRDAASQPPAPTAALPSDSGALTAPPARPSFAKRRALAAQGKTAAGTGDWETCARLYEAAYGWTDAARCVVHTRDTARALDDVRRALVRGWRDADKLEADPELAPLRRDPRWRPLLTEAAARGAAYRGSVNAELERLVRPESPAVYPARPADPRVFAARRARVAEIVAAGGATLPDDYLHAAVVYYRADTAADATRAHELALLALERDPDSDEARWLAAASEDRQLKHEGKPQKYGTQFITTGGKRVLWNIDPAVSDADRERWSIPSLAEAIAGDAETAAALHVGDVAL